ncbi:hypothetical protein [Dongia sp.]|jgi:hypothetical protein|uniref:hypothetical protein n=1 Tax=Dongia sp. TaxID=1977262 RepID=UPI0035B32099
MDWGIWAVSGLIVLAAIGFMIREQDKADMLKLASSTEYRGRFIHQCVASAENTATAAGYLVDNSARAKLYKVCDCAADSILKELPQFSDLSESEMMEAIGEAPFLDKAKRAVGLCEQRFGAQ